MIANYATHAMEAPMEQAVAYPQIVGQVVRYRRKQAEYGLSKFSDQLGLSPSGWNRVESGATTITVTQLRRAARTLGVEPWEVLRDADQLARRVERDQGVRVLDELPKGAAKAALWILGGAAIFALAAAVLSSGSGES